MGFELQRLDPLASAASARREGAPTAMQLGFARHGESMKQSQELPPRREQGRCLRAPQRIFADGIGHWCGAALFALAVCCVAGCAPGGEDADFDTFSAEDVPYSIDITNFIDIALPEDSWIWSDADDDTGSLTPECTEASECIPLLGDLGPCELAVCTNARQCVIGSLSDGAECEDSNACTLASQCSGGVCVLSGAGALLDCFDGNPCTSDDCDPQDGCVYLDRTGPCEDGNECTDGDFCKEGECVGGVDKCPAQCGDTQCSANKGETCETCELDCGTCSNGCTVSLTPGCKGCACEACVCELIAACCTEAWSDDCVAACESPCGASCVDRGAEP
jgi:hypothetical protein